MKKAILAITALCLLLGGGSTSALSAYPDTGANRRSLDFVLKKKYEAGGKAIVRLRNNTKRTYLYNPYYEACKMVFRERGGREFIIPEGTHCDLVVHSKIKPGETVTLFRWDLDECTKDNWGCVRENDLAPGWYTMIGRFRPKGGGDRERVSESFRIVRR
ncbi:MAG: hypothetical protein M3198_17910 [Actinomycetota bacterium]|nr:hypothetical protein [Actinomycetota bacterium]